MTNSATACVFGKSVATNLQCAQSQLLMKFAMLIFPIS